MAFNITKKYDKKDNYLYVYHNSYSYTYQYQLDVRYSNNYSMSYKLSPEIFFLASEIFFLASFKNNPLKDYVTKIKKFVPISQQIVYKNRTLHF